ARHAIADSRWRDAVVGADRWVACDPLSEEATRLAMEAHYLAGDCGAALGRFAAYRARLAQDIGAQPGAAVVELAQRIDADVRAGERTQLTEPETPVPAFQASLVGREGQWRVLVAGWRAMAAGSGRVTLLEGEAGVGKTRLAEDFLRWVRAEGGTVLRGRGYDAATGIPYGPVVEALRGALGFVATLTLGGLEPAAAAARLRRALHTRPTTSVVPVAPLAEDDVWRLIRELARIESPSGGRRFAHRVHEVTDGNPFHVIEMLKTLFVQGVLMIDPATGAWVVAPAASAAD